ncbi:MAG: phosphatase [Cytophagales bacterium]
MKFGVIDIGSNAMRFQVTKVIGNENDVNFKKIEYIRFPLRLGDDVFQNGEISKIKEAKFVKFMEASKMLFDLYEVDDYLVCATSAMRESKNGKRIAEAVKKKCGLEIKIISGEIEALYINNVVQHNLKEDNYIHIDVGGGSTELNIYIDKVKVASESFKIGSVRRLNKMDTPEAWQEMEDWIKTNVQKEGKSLVAIGTGGNIGKIYDLFNGSKSERTISYKAVEETIEKVKKLTLEERINVMMLNPDRADVIVPASEIYLSVMNWAGAKKIFVPEVGLKDGMIQVLYEKHFLGQDLTPGSEAPKKRLFRFF